VLRFGPSAARCRLVPRSPRGLGIVGDGDAGRSAIAGGGLIVSVRSLRSRGVSQMGSVNASRPSRPLGERACFGRDGASMLFVVRIAVAARSCGRPITWPRHHAVRPATHATSADVADPASVGQRAVRSVLQRTICLDLVREDLFESCGRRRFGPGGRWPRGRSRTRQTAGRTCVASSRSARRAYFIRAGGDVSNCWRSVECATSANQRSSYVFSRLASSHSAEPERRSRRITAPRGVGTSVH